MVLVVGWFFTGVGFVAAQFFGEVGAARTVSFAVFTPANALRVVADEGETGALAWVTPFGWRDLVLPYSQDRPWPVLVGTPVSLALVILADVFDSRRELFEAILSSRARVSAPLHTRGLLRLISRLRRGRTLAWSAVIASAASVFRLMESQLETTLRDSEGTAARVEKMSGGGEPVAQFLSLMTVVTILLIVIAAVSRMTVLAADERRGLSELVLTTGVSRSRLF